MTAPLHSEPRVGLEPLEPVSLDPSRTGGYLMSESLKGSLHRPELPSVDFDWPKEAW